MEGSLLLVAIARDVLAGGRVMWDRLHERAQQARVGAAEAAISRASPPAVPPHPPSEITATALADYIRCPRLFWWTHVLGVDRCETAPPQDGLLQGVLETGCVLGQVEGRVRNDPRSVIEECIEVRLPAIP